MINIHYSLTCLRTSATVKYDCFVIVINKVVNGNVKS